MRAKALILINRTAGIGKAGNSLMKVVEKYAMNGLEPIVYPIIPGSDLTSELVIAAHKADFADYDEYISRKNTSEKDAKKFSGKIVTVMCSGGDGTLNHVVNSIMKLDKKPALAYIPSGSTNDFARGIGIPSTPILAAEVAVNGTPFTYDIGKMNNSYFNYVAAFGAFSKVSYATDQELKNVLGYAAYVISAIAELPQNIGYSTHMVVDADGEVEEGDYLFGAVSNSASVAGMSLLADDCIKQDDGLMELLLIRAPKNLAEFNAVVAALATKEPDNPYLTYKQVKSVTFKSSDDVEWTLDGEFGGAHKETQISVINRAITIMTSKK